jgi:hypothetical protein
MVERRAHRHRVGVVAVVHEDDPVAELDALAAEAGESYVRGAIGHRLQRGAEGDAGGDRGQGVGQVVRLGEGEMEALAAGGGRDQRLGHALGDLDLARLDVAARAEAQQARGSLQVRLQLRRRDRDDGDALGRKAVEHLRLGRRDRCHRAEQLDVDRADVGDDRHFGLGDRRQLVDLAAAAHRHLEDQEVGVVRGFEHGQRQPDLGIEVLAVGVDPSRQQRPGDVLDRGLADRAGDPDDAGAESPAVGPGQRLQRRERVVDGKDPGASTLPVPRFLFHECRG